MDLGLSGLASGFDWRSFIDQLSEVERAPQNRLLSEQSLLQKRNTAYGSIKTQLATLQSRIAALKDPSLFRTRSTTSSDTTAATASAAAGAPLGRYTLAVTQLATASLQHGTANAGRRLSETADVSTLALDQAGFATAVTAGTFTVNGKTVSLAATDTLQAVFDKIQTATGGAVSGSYDPATDRIVLAGTGEIVLGSATDTSNFLQVARLYNNGTASVASGSALGSVRLSATLASANLATDLNGGAGGAGQFKINGVAIAFDLASDSLADVLQRINDSAAGVVASYDAVNDRFLLANQSTGDVGMALADVSGNFLAATGLAPGTLQRGQNLLYTLNNSGTLVSTSNTITESSSGIAGLSITVAKEATITIDVTRDTAKIRTAINDFLTDYNKVQSMIDTQTATSTDASGKVTAGLLATESEATEIGARLRRIAYSDVLGLPSSRKHLESLGIVSNSTDNTLTLSDSAKLDTALANDLASVEALFTDATNGIAVKLDAYLEATIGEEGTLVSHQDALTRQSQSIDSQVAELERQVLANRQRMIDSFVAMEMAQAQINQQLQFLEQRFGTT